MKINKKILLSVSPILLELKDSEQWSTLHAIKCMSQLLIDNENIRREKLNKKMIHEIPE